MMVKVKEKEPSYHVLLHVSLKPATDFLWDPMLGTKLFWPMIYIPLSFTLRFFSKWQWKHYLDVHSVSFHLPQNADSSQRRTPDMNNDWASLCSPTARAASSAREIIKCCWPASLCGFSVWVRWCLRSILVTGALYCLCHLVSKNSPNFKVRISVHLGGLASHLFCFSSSASPAKHWCGNSGCNIWEMKFCMPLVGFPNFSTYASVKRAF